VVGATVNGTASTAVNVVKNAKGTGVAAGTDMGFVGVETAASATVEVTVIGIP